MAVVLVPMKVIMYILLSICTFKKNLYLSILVFYLGEILTIPKKKGRGRNKDHPKHYPITGDVFKVTFDNTNQPSAKEGDSLIKRISMLAQNNKLFPMDKHGRILIYQTHLRLIGLLITSLTNFGGTITIVF